MALIICPECGGKVSDKAPACIHCGYPLQSSSLSTANVTENVASIDSFDFSALELEAHNQLNEQNLSAFEYEKLSNGKYVIKKLKNSDELIAVVPDCVQVISEKAFASSGVIDVTLPEGLVKIGARAFANCSDLETINLPSSLKIIESEAFFGCTQLDLEEPQNVRCGKDAFKNTKPWIKKETERKRKEEEERKRKEEEERKRKEEEERKRKEEERKRKYTDGLRFKRDGDSYKVCGYFGTSTDVIIPEIYENLPVTSIGNDAFDGYSSLTSITIPNSVTFIGGRAFYGCSSLTSITIPNSVTSIGAGAFVGCSSLESIVVAKGNPVYYSEGNCIIERNSKTLIQGCNNSTIPQDVTSIGESAFYGCSSLMSITIPNSVTSIGEGAFSGCNSLTSITIPNSVTSIGKYAFYSCSSLTSITIPNSVTSISDWAFYKCNGLTSLTIPNRVTSIGEGAFSGCNSLTSITIPNSVTSIGKYAFYSCSSLTSITIPNNVTSIGVYAFYYCSSLTSITIPNSVTSIGGYAFYYCSSLESIEFEGTVKQWKAIQKHVSWNFNTGNYTIKCSNGIVNKSN